MLASNLHSRQHASHAQSEGVQSAQSTADQHSPAKVLRLCSQLSLPSALLIRLIAALCFCCSLLLPLLALQFCLHLLLIHNVGTLVHVCRAQAP